MRKLETKPEVVVTKEMLLEKFKPHFESQGYEVGLTKNDRIRYTY